MLRRIAFVVLLVFAGVSCSRDPNVVKKKYLQNGNRYFDKGKYKEALIMYRNAMNKDRRYSEAYYRAGLTELRLQQPFDALRDFRRAADTDPGFTNPDARVQVGNILLLGYLLREDHPASVRDELRGISDELLKRDPKSVPALRLKGYLKLTADRDAKAAIEQFQLANQISPGNPEIVLPLVESLFADGRNDDAEKAGKDLIQKQKTFLPMYDVLYVFYARANRIGDAEQILKTKVASNPKSPEALLQLAQFYYRLQRRPEMQAALDKLVADSKTFPDGRLRAGRFYRAIRDYDAAIRLFQDGAKQDAEHKADYQKDLAQVLIAENKKNEAANLLAEVLKANPKDEGAQAMRASLLIETGDPKQVQQAITDLQASLANQPANPVLRFNLGRALLLKGQIEQARVQFQEALKIRREYIPARIALAEIHLSKREFPDAIQDADAALEFDKQNLQARLIRASAQAALGNNTQAREELQETMKRFPNSEDAALQLAGLDLRDQNYKAAEDAFLRLYKSNPADLRPLMGLTQTYSMQKQWSKAIDVLQAELAKNPGRLEIRSAIADTAARSGQFDQAIQQYQTILQSRPDASDIYVHLGLTYSAKGDLQNAVNSFEKARQLRPNDIQPYLQLAFLYERMGKQPSARPIYEQILKLQPDQPVALNNLAYIIAESPNGDLDQALSLAQRAHQKLPENPDVADTLGWIYIKKNLSDNAVSIFRDLVAKKPDNSTYHYHLGMALYQRGDKPQARKELESALGRKPSAQEAAKIKDLMGRIG